MTKQSGTCVCGNLKVFKKCCGRFLQSGQDAKTPEQLMRSRFSAYALGGYGEYLMNTWFPATATGLSAAELSVRSCDWKKLEVIRKSQQGDNGMVEFKAYFKKEFDTDLSMMHEYSTFKRSSSGLTKGKWYYVGGEVK